MCAPPAIIDGICVGHESKPMKDETSEKYNSTFITKASFHSNLFWILSQKEFHYHITALCLCGRQKMDESDELLAGYLIHSSLGNWKFVYFSWLFSPLDSAELFVRWQKKTTLTWVNTRGQGAGHTLCRLLWIIAIVIAKVLGLGGPPVESETFFLQRRTGPAVCILRTIFSSKIQNIDSKLISSIATANFSAGKKHISS